MDEIFNNKFDTPNKRYVIIINKPISVFYIRSKWEDLSPDGHPQHQGRKYAAGLVRRSTLVVFVLHYQQTLPTIK